MLSEDDVENGSKEGLQQPKLCVNHYSGAAKSVSLRPSKFPAAIILSYLSALTIAVLFYRDLQKTLEDGLVAESYPEIAQGSNSNVSSSEGLFDPSCTTFLLMSSSHYLQSNSGLPQCQNTPCCIHPYNLMSLAPRCHKTKTPVAIQKKQQTKTKNKTHNKKKPPKLHLKPREDMIKIHQSNTTLKKKYRI